MSEHCGFNIFEECNCGGECKSATIPLAAHIKPRPAPCASPTYQYALCVLFALLSILFGVAEGAGQQKVIDRDRQEITHVARN